MWGVAIFILWEVFQGSYGTNAKWIAVIPPAFIAFGDGITGIVRNFGFKERSKHPIGNIFMALACIPLGYYFGSFSGIAIGGAVAGLIASIVELFEFGPIDDNVFITIISSLFLVFCIFNPVF